MSSKTPQVATHLLKNPRQYITPLGSFLRRTSLDEIPQIYSVLKGDMTLVGPRPALYNQYDLIKLRSNYKIQKLRPGITGLAQIKGRDFNSNIEKTKLDYEYLKHHNILLDLKIIFITSVNILLKSNISH